MVGAATKKKIIKGVKKYLNKHESATARELSIYLMDCEINFPSDPTACNIAMILRGHEDFTSVKKSNICLWRLK